MPETTDLTVHDLLRVAYRKLGRKHRSLELHFPDGVCVEIADDSDGHRTKKGYFRYRSAKMMRVGRQWWALARGERCGAYPADPYDSDIAAIPLPGRLKVGPEATALVADQLRRGEYFRHSLVVGLSDGRLDSPRTNPLNVAILGLIESELPAVVASPAQRDGRYLDLSTFAPVVIRSVRYKREAIGVLVRMIDAVLGL